MIIKDLIKKLSEYPDAEARILLPGDEPYDIADVVYDNEQDYPVVFVVVAS